MSTIISQFIFNFKKQNINVPVKGNYYMYKYSR